MKKILLAITLALTLNGCDIETFFKKIHVKEEFKSLCNRYELAICGEKKIPEYNNADIYEVEAVSYDIIFEYVREKDDKYDYMESAPHRGDCEDWTITFIENNLRLGNFDRGEVKWISGKLNGNGHAWTLVTKNGKTILFDNGYTYGIPKDVAYNERGYNQMITVYSY